MLCTHESHYNGIILVIYKFNNINTQNTLSPIRSHKVKCKYLSGDPQRQADLR